MYLSLVAALHIGAYCKSPNCNCGCFVHEPLSGTPLLLIVERDSPRRSLSVRCSEHQRLCVICSTDTFEWKGTRTEHENKVRNSWLKSECRPARPGSSECQDTDLQSKVHPSTSTSLNDCYDIVALYMKSRPTRLHDVNDDSMMTRQLDTQDCRTSRRRNGVDANHAYWTVLVGILYWPAPSKITVIDDVTIRQVAGYKCQTSTTLVK